MRGKTIFFLAGILLISACASTNYSLLFKDLHPASNKAYVMLNVSNFSESKTGYYLLNLSSNTMLADNLLKTAQTSIEKKGYQIAEINHIGIGLSLKNGTQATIIKSYDETYFTEKKEKDINNQPIVVKKSMKEKIKTAPFWVSDKFMYLKDISDFPSLFDASFQAGIKKDPLIPDISEVKNLHFAGGSTTVFISVYAYHASSVGTALANSLMVGLIGIYGSVEEPNCSISISMVNSDSGKVIWRDSISERGNKTDQQISTMLENLILRLPQ